MIESRELEAFLAVAESLHFGQAAEQLGLSTSRVSQLVRTFERRVGAPLFERTSRRVQLTEQGGYLLRELHPAAVQIQRALAGVRNLDGETERTLRVGFDTSLPTFVGPELVAAFAQRHPRCRVIWSSHPTADLFSWQEKADWPIDTFVTWMPSGSVPGLQSSAVLLRMPRAVATAETHPFAGRESVSAEELADHPVGYPDLPGWYNDYLLPRAAASGRAIKARLIPTRYTEEVLRRVSADAGLAYLVPSSLPSTCCHSGVSVVPVTGLPPLTVRAVWPIPATSVDSEAFALFAADHATSAGWRSHASD